MVARHRFGDPGTVRPSQAHARRSRRRQPGARTMMGRSPDRVRGVFPLPYLASERTAVAPSARIPAGGGRNRAVSKMNLVIGLLNLLFGGSQCLAAAWRRVPPRLSSALSCAAHRAELGFLRRRYGGRGTRRPTTRGLRPDQELHAAVDTVPDRKPRASGRAAARALPSELAERYADESRVVRGGIHAEAAAVFAIVLSCRPPSATLAFHSLVKSYTTQGCWWSWTPSASASTCSPSPAGRLQRLVVDPRPSNAAWGDPPLVQLTAGLYWRGSCGGGGRDPRRRLRAKAAHR